MTFNDPQSDDREQRYHDFVALLARHEVSIRRFTRSLLPTTEFVDDVVQDTALECWRKFADQFYIDTVRIGPAEIGNWGQPFRKTPSFAVRNLNGSIDEIAVFKAALPADEIRDLYEQGRPLGY